MAPAHSKVLKMECETCELTARFNLIAAIFTVNYSVTSVFHWEAESTGTGEIIWSAHWKKNKTSEYCIAEGK